MKKLLFVILIMMCIPFYVSAKEYCKVVSGNGKNIGSEIACGTEHFYVLSNDNNQIRMLAKYNLYTGYTIESYLIEKEEGDTRTDYQYCDDLANEKGASVKKIEWAEVRPA